MYDNVVAQRIALQNGKAPLMDFASVNTDTPLESLNLNWREKDLPERERTKHVHRLHPYLGKFIPQLVEIFLRKYQPTLVYDPFVGSGTTLVEANALGIDSIGTDVSAFNVMLATAKTANYDISVLRSEFHDILLRLATYKKKFGDDAKLKRKLETSNKYLNEWFAPTALQELLCYQKMIKRYTYQELLRVVLCRSARSARLVTHFDLDFPKKPQTAPYQCYKHRRECQPTAEAYKFLYRYTLDTLDRVTEFSKKKTKATVVVNHADSRHVKLPQGIDLVFTSPPYVGLIDYHDQHKYAYELLGLENNDQLEIGPAKNGQSVQAKAQYIQGINEVFLHTRDYMSKNGLLLIVVNDKHRLYDPANLGFQEIGRVERHVNRRTGRREGAFFESILIWKKR